MAIDEQVCLLVSDEGYGTVENGKKSITLVPVEYNHGILPKPRRTLVKTQSSFWEDARYFKDGSIPHSCVLALVIGTVCGVASFVYYKMLFWLLDVVWHTLPSMIVVGVWPEWAYVLWIPLVGFTMAIGVGMTVIYMGEPGDLPYTVKCLHEKGYLAMGHVMPMVRNRKPKNGYLSRWTHAISPINRFVHRSLVLLEVEALVLRLPW